jgi:flagellar basal-body rod modification protein FlgD
MTAIDSTSGVSASTSAAAAAAAASAVTSNAAGSTNTSTASTALGQNYQTFLQLLTTQLQNQDPLDPTDSSQFTNQLVLFSQVEQQINTNTNLQTLITAQDTAASSSALSYLGMNVAAGGSAFTYSGGSVALGYTLPSTSAITTIDIFDSNNNEVYTTSGATASGANEFTWDGTETSGATAPDGIYTIQVSAADSSGNSLTVTTETPGQVTGVSNADGTTYLTVNGQQVPESSVVSASLPTSSSSSSSSSATD